MQRSRILSGLIGAAGVAALAAPGVGADLDRGGVFASPSRISQAWNGFYVGGQLGFTFANYDVTLTPGPSQFTITPASFAGGLLAGVNASVTQNVVLGAEADIAFMNAAGDRTIGGARYFGQSGTMATVRGRLGMTFDQFMIYGTAGAAFAGIDHGGPAGRASRTRLGYVIGAGIEANLTRQLFVRAEYLFSGFGSESYAIGGGQSIGAPAHMHSVRGAIGWRF